MSETNTDNSSFIDAYIAGRSQLRMRRLVSDLETPVSAYLKLAGDERYGFLLESVEGGESLGRYSVIGMAPDALWRSDGGKSACNLAPAQSDDFTPEDGAPLENLKKFAAAAAIDITPDGAPPMTSGVFGFLGYDMVRQMEHLPDQPAKTIDTPDALFIRPTLLAIFDNIRQEIILATPARPQAGVGADDAMAAADARLNAAAAALSAPFNETARGPIEETPSPANLDIQSNMTPDDYMAMVEKGKTYIGKGDVFQVVLSQQFSTPFAPPPFRLYRALRRTNPSPFLFFLNFDGLALVGSSPEILVRVRDGEVTIRPIAGTRRRGATKGEDEALAHDLLGDPKERSEHLMLLDLGRNDVGRSAEIGSVKVTEQFIIERYSHVMHIVSNVTGRLKRDLHPLDAVCGGFPAGTVSGAPKVRAMEIIDELEPSARGVYGGAIGYFTGDGNIDTCIALRTGLVKDGRLYVQAGAGIVADSVPASEHEECVNKAKALFSAAAAAITAEETE